MVSAKKVLGRGEILERKAPRSPLKAVLKHTHSRRFANTLDAWQTRSVWTAVGLPPLSRAKAFGIAETPARGKHDTILPERSLVCPDHGRLFVRSKANCLFERSQSAGVCGKSGDLCRGTQRRVQGGRTED